MVDESEGIYTFMQNQNRSQYLTTRLERPERTPAQSKSEQKGCQEPIATIVQLHAGPYKLDLTLNFFV